MSKSAINLSNLKRALKVVEPAIARGVSALPIMQSVRMEQLSDGLAVEATNLDIAIRALLNESSGPAEAIVIPSDRLLAWAKLLKGEDVTISTTDNKATVKSGRARAVLPLLKASGWPAGATFNLDGPRSIVTLQQGAFARALRIGMIAMSEDDSRYALQSVQLSSAGDKLRIASSNGHTLAVYTIKSDAQIKSLLLPAAFLRALLPLLINDEGGVDISFDDRLIVAAVAGEVPVFVNGKQMSRSFPRWEMLIPKDDRKVVIADAGELVEALVRAALLADQKSGAITMHFETAGEIVIEGADSQAGEARETVVCDGPAHALSLRLNSDYMIDMIKKLSGPVFLHLPADNTQALWITAKPAEDESLDYIVMPLRA